MNNNRYKKEDDPYSKEFKAVKGLLMKPGEVIPGKTEMATYCIRAIAICGFLKRAEYIATQQQKRVYKQYQRDHLLTFDPSYDFNIDNLGPGQVSPPWLRYHPFADMRWYDIGTSADPIPFDEAQESYEASIMGEQPCDQCIYRGLQLRMGYLEARAITLYDNYDLYEQEVEVLGEAFLQQADHLLDFEQITYFCYENPEFLNVVYNERDRMLKEIREDTQSDQDLEKIIQSNDSFREAVKKLRDEKLRKIRTQFLTRTLEAFYLKLEKEEPSDEDDEKQRLLDEKQFNEPLSESVRSFFEDAQKQLQEGGFQMFNDSSFEDTYEASRALYEDLYDAIHETLSKSNPFTRQFLDIAEKMFLSRLQFKLIWVEAEWEKEAAAERKIHQAFVRKLIREAESASLIRDSALYDQLKAEVDKEKEDCSKKVDYTKPSSRLIVLDKSSFDRLYDQLKAEVDTEEEDRSKKVDYTKPPSRPIVRDKSRFDRLKAEIAAESSFSRSEDTSEGGVDSSLLQQADRISDLQKGLEGISDLQKGLEGISDLQKGLEDMFPEAMSDLMKFCIVVYYGVFSLFLTVYVYVLYVSDR